MRYLLSLLIIIYSTTLATPAMAADPSWTELLRSIFPVVTAQDVPITTDTDGDGVPDSLDRCPEVGALGSLGVTEEGCPQFPDFYPAQTVAVELRPQPCDTAPCRVRISHRADLIPFVDCIMGLLTNPEGTIIRSKGPLLCIEPASN